MTAQLTAPAPPPPDVAAPGALAGRAGRVLLGLALLVAVAGVVGGLLAGPLWLDEAISVEIARRPVPDLLATLRIDGSPPLYYLLLHGWMSVAGTGTVAVRLLSALLVPPALWLTWRLGVLLRGREGGVASVVVLSVLPWTLRYGSETRMYLLVVVLVLAGALLLHAVRTTPAPWPVVGLGVCTAGLLYTHYWSLFLAAAVAAWHAPGVLRRKRPALRVAAGMALAGVLFLPQVPTLLYQSAHTGAPWAARPGLEDVWRTPTAWFSGPLWASAPLGALLVLLVVVAVRRVRPARPAALVGTATLLVAWTATHVLGGAYVARYTAVAVPLVAVAAGLGATALSPRRGIAALAALVVAGAVFGVPAANASRGPAGRIAQRFLASARPGDVLAYCPDQLGPPVAREVGPGYPQVVYPTLGPPDIVNWVDYAERNRAADPRAVARQLDALAGGRALFLVKASGYRTYRRDSVDDCNRLVNALWDLRGEPTRLYGRANGNGQKLYRYSPR